ncbi:hypothetical protein Ancab_019154 [Ancistrocladus abbreviatus]
MGVVLIPREKTTSTSLKFIPVLYNHSFWFLGFGGDAELASDLSSTIHCRRTCNVVWKLKLLAHESCFWLMVGNLKDILSHSQGYHGLDGLNIYNCSGLACIPVAGFYSTLSISMWKFLNSG